ncbi:hypothetical protein BT96DRAFT_923202 [Gymnopus androsaceus JB14]|uniref:SigF-like NTF2-like domain-containing protein n=1 Tax=Gymnopus androsaceus JB14 TaxID=1447944 RepID=A0A6A4H9R6_9AGAR|nr:hypothetical protein BT96DRAFT_923202 [Gymnopus androsaceus JB14]
MQDPEREITAVVLSLITAETPDIQLEAFKKYVASDVGFKHPLCYVPPSRDSREILLGIYQWYRIMSPKIVAEIHSVVYDKENHIILLDVSQIFHLRFSPFKPAWSRLLVRITLKEINGLYYISFQEDFYHVEDFARLLVPMLAPVIRFAQVGASIGSNVCDKIGQTLGFWRPMTRREASLPDSGLYDGNKTD